MKVGSNGAELILTVDGYWGAPSVSMTDDRLVTFLDASTSLVLVLWYINDKMQVTEKWKNVLQQINVSKFFMLYQFDIPLVWITSIFIKCQIFINSAFVTAS